MVPCFDQQAAVGFLFLSLNLVSPPPPTCMFQYSSTPLHQHEMRSSIAVSLSLFAITAISVIIGAFLPLAFDRCGLDPAHAGPAIQVVMDVTGVLMTCAICAAIASDVGVVAPADAAGGLPDLHAKHSVLHGTSASHTGPHTAHARGAFARKEGG